MITRVGGVTQDSGQDIEPIGGNTEQEVWKTVVGYEGIYEVSNFGNVKSLNFGKEKILKSCDGTGYLIIVLSINNKQKNISTHRLVALTFIPNPENKNQVNHKNGIKCDNRVENLEWVTAKENMQHAIKTGLNKVTENNNFKKNNPKHSLGKFGKDNHKSKTVNQFSLLGEFIKEWGGTMEVERELGISHSGISMCCSGKRKISGGFIWNYN